MVKAIHCNSCKLELTNDTKYKHNNRYYCKSCYDNIIRLATEYKAFIDFICVEYQIEKPTGLMLRQMKEYHDEFGYSYAAMHYTLWYSKVILGKTLIPKYGISLIKYNYDGAKEYFEQQSRLTEQVTNIETTTAPVVHKTVNVSSHKNKRTFSAINLNNIATGGDEH